MVDFNGSAIQQPCPSDGALAPRKKQTEGGQSSLSAISKDQSSLCDEVFEQWCMFLTLLPHLLWFGNVDDYPAEFSTVAAQPPRHKESRNQGDVWWISTVLCPAHPMALQHQEITVIARKMTLA
jgi:hypothetical protein